MRPHLTADELQAFRQRTLPAPSLNEVSRHICECESCRLQLEAQDPQLLSASAATRPFLVARSEHLPYDDLQAAVDGAPLSGAQLNHLAACTMCSRELRDLREFAASLSHSARVVRQSYRVPLFVAAAAVLVLASGSLLVRRHVAPPAPALTAQLHDAGSIIGLDASGGLQAPASLGGDNSRLLAAVLASHRLSAPPALQAPSTVSMVFRGAPQAPAGFSVLSPIGDVVYTPTPAFRWQPLNAALSYRVIVYDAAYRRVSQSEPLTVTEWTPATPLIRGQFYTWAVVATTPGGTARAPQSPTPDARFQVLSQAEAVPIQAALRQHSDAHLLLAALYAQAGAREEARFELNQLQAENPGSPLVQELEKSLAVPPPQT